MPGPSGAQHLFDCQQQSISVSKHDVVKLRALLFVNIPRLQCFEVKTNRGDRSFQFMCDCVDESIVLLVATDLSDQESRVEHESKDQNEKKDDPKNKQGHFAPVENYPTDVQRDRKRDKTRTQRDKECY